MLQKLWLWCKKSATIVWARIQYLGGVLIAALIAAFSGFDFTRLLTMSKYDVVKMLSAVAVAGIITEVARRRSLSPGA